MRKRMAETASTPIRRPGNYSEPDNLSLSFVHARPGICHPDAASSSDLQTPDAPDQVFIAGGGMCTIFIDLDPGIEKGAKERP
jgi:hypothetical protein